MPGSFANIGAKEYLAEFSDREGILFVGKAQEKGVRRPYDHEETSHEYAKRQLDKRGIKYEPLDNGILSCEDPQALQKICEGLNEAKIDRLLRKWLKRLPHQASRALPLISG